MNAAAAGTAVPTAAPVAVMHDCSNDESGLPLAKLKVEQRWTSAAGREPWDITLVTQLNPGRRDAVSLGFNCPLLLSLADKLHGLFCDETVDDGWLV